MTEMIYDVPASWAKKAWLNDAKYKKMYAASIKDPDKFWAEHGKRVDWIKPYTKVKNVSYGPGDVSIKWFEDGTLNVAANCIDRHLRTRGRSGRDHLGGRRPHRRRRSPIASSMNEVCKFANVMKAKGVKKGDRVTIYMPMIPEAAYAMLACARIGAMHSVVFGGFSPDSSRGASRMRTRSS
jgi:acetyl-CoA synthetase